MLVTDLQTILDFIQQYQDSQSSLLSWLAEVQRRQWANPNQMQQSFGTASLVSPWTMFNIAGNNHRMITAIDDAAGTVFIAGIFTHKEYDKGHWKA